MLGARFVENGLGQRPTVGYTAADVNARSDVISLAIATRRLRNISQVRFLTVFDCFCLLIPTNPY